MTTALIYCTEQPSSLAWAEAEALQTILLDSGAYTQVCVSSCMFHDGFSELWSFESGSGLTDVADTLIYVTRHGLEGLPPSYTSYAHKICSSATADEFAEPNVLWIPFQQKAYKQLGRPSLAENHSHLAGCACMLNQRIYDLAKAVPSEQLSFALELGQCMAQLICSNELNDLLRGLVLSPVVFIDAKCELAKQVSDSLIVQDGSDLNYNLQRLLLEPDFAEALHTECTALFERLVQKY